ncbi:MFS transporter [Schaalia sp. ZJ405]|uniref:MFS transporter n=1 Tax=Schaalia sp. ZJ405 TaxID=2709403 RepID=UPI0018C96096|nr:MFS transporter [Schaalia sp. ZJ405]
MSSTGDSSTPQIPRMNAHLWGIVSVSTVAVMLLAIDGTVLSLAVPHLTQELAPTSSEILWIGDIYSFTLAGLLVIMGNVADRFGRKKVLLIGALGFTLASTLAAFAPSAEILIAARALQGAFGATIMPSTLSIIRDSFRQPQMRTRAIAIWSIGATGGAAAGPLVGGFLLEHFWWGSVFLINLPIMMFLIAAAFPILRESYGDHTAPIDLLSALMSVVAVIPVVYSVKHIAHDGLDASAWVSALIGITAGIMFIRRQRRLTHPLLDVSLFGIPAFTGAVLSVTISIFALVGLLFFFSQYLQLVLGYTPLQAGLFELAATAASIAANLCATRLLIFMGRGRAVSFGLVLMALGMGILALAEGNGTLWLLICAIGILGFGSGVAMPLATDAVVSSAPIERAGAASGVSETAYELGSALGIAILGSLQASLYRSSLDIPTSLEPDLVTGIRQSLAQALASLDMSDPTQAAIAQSAREAFTHGMQLTATAAAAIIILGAAIALTVIPSRHEDADSFPA